jgi:hypothetical protein
VHCPSAANDVVLGADARSVIYRFPIAAEMVPPYIFGCAAGVGRSYKLGRVIEGSASGPVGTGPFALAGPVVAYSVEESHTSGINFNESSREIVVRNLANGKVALKVPNGSPAEPGDVGLGETTAIVVKRDGAVAWINRASGALGSVCAQGSRRGSKVPSASSERACCRCAGYCLSGIWRTQTG